MRAAFEAIESGADVGHREGRVDHGFHEAATKYIEQLAELADAAAGRSEDLELPDEDPLQIGGRIGAGGGAASDQPSPAAQRFQRFAPTRGPDAVDHHV